MSQWSAAPVSGAQTAGRYCLIDMIVPDGSGPPLHRHDFEEMFTLLEGDRTREVKKDRIVVITRVDGGVGPLFVEQLLRQGRSGPKSRG
jgi:mannose-6-phosphate isomerase-like protein (cupin superfamily)